MKAARIRTVFFLVEVATARLNALTARFEEGKLATQVGSVLPLAQARRAHECWPVRRTSAGKSC